MSYRCIEAKDKRFKQWNFMDVKGAVVLWQ